MKILQKFAAVLVFCSAVLFASSADARVVQICDMGAYALYNDSNAVLAGIGNPYRLNNLKHVGKMSPDSYYDLYVAGIGGGGEGAVISLRKATFQKLSLWQTGTIRMLPAMLEARSVR